jgi:hypothetical protein
MILVVEIDQNTVLFEIEGMPDSSNGSDGFREPKSAHYDDSRMYSGASMRFMKGSTVTGAYALPSSVSIRGAHLGALKPPLQLIASGRSAESDFREGKDEVVRASIPEGSQSSVFRVPRQPRAIADHLCRAS